MGTSLSRPCRRDSAELDVQTMIGTSFLASVDVSCARALGARDEGMQSRAFSMTASCHEHGNMALRCLVERSTAQAAITSLDSCAAWCRLPDRRASPSIAAVAKGVIAVAGGSQCLVRHSSHLALKADRSHRRFTLAARTVAHRPAATSTFCRSIDPWPLRLAGTIPPAIPQPSKPGRTSSLAAAPSPSLARRLIGFRGSSASGPGARASIVQPQRRRCSSTLHWSIRPDFGRQSWPTLTAFVDDAGETPVKGPGQIAKTSTTLDAVSAVTSAADNPGEDILQGPHPRLV